MVLLEAAACGLPIVSFACPHGPKTLLSKGGGILAEAENIEQLAAGISKMIHDNEFREKCRHELPIVVNEYLPETIYNQWSNLLGK